MRLTEHDEWGDQDEVKKNDMGMMLNKPNSAVALA